MKSALTVLIAAILLGATVTAAGAGAAAGAEPPAASTGATAPAAATTATPAAPAAPAPPATAPAPAAAAAPAAPPASSAPTDSAATTATATPAAAATPATPDQATPAAGAKPDAKASAKASAKGKPKSKAGAAKPAPPAKPPPKAPKPPVPDPALAQLKSLAGTWTCTGHTFGPGPEHSTTATMTLAWHLDGFWLEIRYEEAKSAANPVPLSSVSEWGFDLLQKTLTSTTVDNVSGIDTQTTAGWQGDKLVFEGSARRFGTQFLDRDTFVRHGDSQLVHTLEASVNDSWIKLHEDTCNRVPSK